MIVFTGFLPLQSMFIEIKKKRVPKPGSQRKGYYGHLGIKATLVNRTTPLPAINTPFAGGRSGSKKGRRFRSSFVGSDAKFRSLRSRKALSMAGLEGTVVSCRNVDEWTAHFKHGVDSKKLVIYIPTLFFFFLKKMVAVVGLYDLFVFCFLIDGWCLFIVVVWLLMDLCADILFIILGPIGSFCYDVVCGCDRLNIDWFACNFILEGGFDDWFVFFFYERVCLCVCVYVQVLCRRRLIMLCQRYMWI